MIPDLDWPDLRRSMHYLALAVPLEWSAPERGRWWRSLRRSVERQAEWLARERALQASMIVPANDP